MSIKTLMMTCGLILCLLAQPVVAGPLEDGEAAFKRGEFAIALQILKPLAEQGDASAQHILGLMYELGFGVPQDLVESAKWNLKAAEQGNGIAQSDTGWIYYRGLGVSRNIVLAYMWLYLSVAHGEEQNIHNIADIALEMTPDQIAEAQRLAREWTASHPKK